MSDIGDETAREPWSSYRGEVWTDDGGSFAGTDALLAFLRADHRGLPKEVER